MNEPKKTHYVEWVKKDALGREFAYTGPHLTRPEAEAMASKALKDGGLRVQLHEVGAIR